MKRVFSDFAYSEGPRSGCWWDETIVAPIWPTLTGEVRADVGVIGGGFTGLSAALTLAEAGVSVAVLEANSPGWGASGRNGGFCCLGGGKIGNAELERKFGTEGRMAFRQAEKDAVALVEDRLDRHGIDVDRHSKGETQLAHRPKAMDALRDDLDEMARDYRIEPRVTEAEDLAAEGLNGGFFGAVTLPLGFGLNPRKYLVGLAGAAGRAGAKLCQESPVLQIESRGSQLVLHGLAGTLRCDRVLIATNGYSSDDVPHGLAGRYIPAQSTVLVTRPMSDAELSAQGWTSDQMSYDSRSLLHYFRLMPDRRFLFGMRGGLLSGPRAEARARARTRADFEAMFPAWRHVQSAHSWSGMVCLARNKVPFIGTLSGSDGILAALAYHGNGVAMGSWAGTQAARLILDPTLEAELPAPMRAPMRRFPLGRARRLLMGPAYAALALRDRF